MLNWYAIYVNVRHEKKVVQKLQDLHLEAYSPVIKKLQQWSDRKKWVEFPMLSGYVFVRVDSTEKEKVLTCAGVFAFIKFNGVEAKIRDTEIAVLKSVELSGYDVITETSDVKLADEVEITQGPLKGLKGIVIQFQNLNYIQIQLESLHQSIKVQLPKHILKVQPSTIS